MDHSSASTLTTKQECVSTALRLIGNAEHRIAIFSQELEPLLYNNAAVCELMSNLARKNRHSAIRILAQQTRSVAADGHCLVHLAQRLSSSVQIRIPSTPEIQHFNKSWLIIDNHSIMQIDNPDRHEGSVIEHDRLHVKTQLEFFDHAWENSLPDPNTRRLNI